jgi:hypothetical protein
MGGAASIPDQLDAAMAQSLAGDQWDQVGCTAPRWAIGFSQYSLQERFLELSMDGSTISREQFQRAMVGPPAALPTEVRERETCLWVCPAQPATTLVRRKIPRKEPLI